MMNVIENYYKDAKQCKYELIGDVCLTSDHGLQHYSCRCDLLSAVQTRVYALPDQQGVMWGLVRGDRESGEGGGMADYHRVLL